MRVFYGRSFYKGTDNKIKDAPHQYIHIHIHTKYTKNTHRNLMDWSTSTFSLSWYTCHFSVLTYTPLQ